jgi:hypothetical protein
VLKEPKIRSEKHRRFIASLPCCVSGLQGQTQAAHIRTQTGGGMGLKPSDIWCIPLSVVEHQRQHNFKGGEKAYWELHGGTEKFKELAKNLWVYSGDEFKCSKLIAGFINDHVYS